VAFMKINRTAITLATVGSMQRTVLLAVAATLASHVAAAHVVRHRSIPEPYIGRWAPDTGACKESDKSVIVLSAKAYDSPEAKCAVDWVSETPGPHGPIFSAHLQCRALGAQAKKAAMSNIIIRPDSDHQIAMGPDFESLKPYQRCPAIEPSATR
jgi:hypothetical protein